MIIYKITNKINGKQYIGQSIFTLEKRWSEHLRSYRNGKTQYLYKAMRKHGAENFEIEQVMRCVSEKDLNEKEAFCVRIYGTFAPNGYNCTTGGNQYRLDEESKKKIGAKKKGKKLSPEHAASLRELAQRSMNDPVMKMKFLIANGSKWFYVYQAILVEKHNSQKPSKTAKGKLIGKWLNTIDCAKDLNINPKGISKNLKNKNKTYKGYIFEYEGELKNLESVSKFYPKEKNGRPACKVPKKVIMVETGEIFESIKEVAKKLGTIYSNINHAIRKNRKVQGKYTFKYLA